MNTLHSVLILVVVAAITILLRFLPFLLFGKGTPDPITYLGGVLPYAIMAMLVVYCLKNTTILSSPHGIPEAVSVALVVLIHKWKHSTLLSILVGTVTYMLLVQFLF